MGGKSAEREASFNSGRTICDHLDSELYEIIPLFQTQSGEFYILPWYFLHRGKISDFEGRLIQEGTKSSLDSLRLLIDFAYIAMHGRFGEDGCLAGALEILGIPYLGSGVFSSSLAMNKIMHNRYLKLHNIEIPPQVVVDIDIIYRLYNEDHKNNEIEIIKKHMIATGVSFPVIVKPALEGSSLGITIANSIEDLSMAILHAAQVNSNQLQAVIIEKKIIGMEFTCILVEKDNNGAFDKLQEWIPLSITEIVPEAGTQFYDYQQKYMPGRASKITPARCSVLNKQKIFDICIKVAQILEFNTLARIDGFLTHDDNVIIIESNPLSGMGPAHFLFHQAAEINMSHTTLINYLIHNDLMRYNLGNFLIKQEDMIDAKENQEAVNQKIRIAVLFGGSSNEREISLESGRNVCYKLPPHKYEVSPLFVSQDMELYLLSQRLLIQNSTREISDLIDESQKILWSDLPGRFDFVFNALHGGKGENGCVQGMLEMLGIPYNGSGVLTSALCMDKYKTNRWLAEHHFHVPNAHLLSRIYWQKLANNDENAQLFFEKIKHSIGYPLIIKPADDGCSVFVSKISNHTNLKQAIDNYFACSEKDSVMIESFMQGIELTVGVLGNEKPFALPPSMPLIADDILSIEEKFLPGAGENQTPAPLAHATTTFVQREIERVYMALGCQGYARIDCFYQDAIISPTKEARLVILEVNTLPGLTPATCIFHQAAEIGLSPMAFIDRIVMYGLASHNNMNTVHESLAVQETLRAG